MTFATFDASSYSFDEDVQEFRIPVKIVNPNGMEISLSVATNDGKAEEGVDYEIIYPVSGVLAFASGETEQDIVIGITEFPGKLTGSKDFTVEISSVTEGISVGGCNTVKMKIMDLDHTDIPGYASGDYTLADDAEAYQYGFEKLPFDEMGRVTE